MRGFAFLALIFWVASSIAHADVCCDSVDDCPLQGTGDTQAECVSYDPETHEQLPCNEAQAGWCAYFYAPAPMYQEGDEKAPRKTPARRGVAKAKSSGTKAKTPAPRHSPKARS